MLFIERYDIIKCNTIYTDKMGEVMGKKQKKKATVFSVILVLIEVLSNICGITGYNIKDLMEGVKIDTQAINMKDKSKYYIARANAYEKLGDMENYILNNTMGMLKTLN